MKKLAIGCGTVCGIFIIAFICFAIWLNNMIDDSLSKKEIFDLVNDNYTIILRNIDEKDFSVKYSNDDNCYYTEKIRDNFYYYEAYF